MSKSQIIITLKTGKDAHFAFLSDKYSKDDAVNIGLALAMLNNSMYYNVIQSSLVELATKDSDTQLFCEEVFKTWQEQEIEISQMLGLITQESEVESDEEPPMIPADKFPIMPIQGVVEQDEE